MSGTEDKIKGKANEAIGHAKQGLGKAMDNKEMQAEGVIQEAKGKGQGVVGAAKDKLDDVRDDVRDRAKDENRK